MALNSISIGKDRFLVCHDLLCKWQTDLEYLLYHFCRINAPQLLDECLCSCAEAAELSRLTEKVTNHFCFCSKRIFRERGISEQERETFCTQLQKVRQVRNMAVHRVTPQSSTIRKYGKIFQAIIGFLPRIGGREFLQTYNDRIRQFIEIFWDIEKRESGEVNGSPIAETIVIRGIESSPRNKQKEYNMKRSVEEQKLAAKIKANNISQMARDFHDSRRVKLMHIEQTQRERVDSELRKKEKSERLIKQLADAQLRKDERADRNKKQQDEAQIRRAERAARNRQQTEDAQKAGPIIKHHCTRGTQAD